MRAGSPLLCNTSKIANRVRYAMMLRAILKTNHVRVDSGRIVSALRLATPEALCGRLIG